MATYSVYIFYIVLLAIKNICLCLWCQSIFYLLCSWCTKIEDFICKYFSCDALHRCIDIEYTYQVFRLTPTPASSLPFCNKIMDKFYRLHKQDDHCLVRSNYCIKWSAAVKALCKVHFYDVWEITQSCKSFCHILHPNNDHIGPRWHRRVMNSSVLTKGGSGSEWRTWSNLPLVSHATLVTIFV